MHDSCLPATPEQLEVLKQLGVRLGLATDKAFARQLIEEFQATSRQSYCMARMGVHPPGPVHRREASEIIGRQVQIRREQPPTRKQEVFLRRHGQWKDELSYGQAYDLIGRICRGERVD